MRVKRVLAQLTTYDGAREECPEGNCPLHMYSK
jgi:hypothetical protein